MTGAAVGGTITAEGWGIDTDKSAMLQLSTEYDYVSLPETAKAHLREVVKLATKGLSQEIGETDEEILP